MNKFNRLPSTEEGFRQERTGLGKLKLMFSEDDIRQIESHSLTIDVVMSQLETFRRGLPFTILDRAATIGDGVLKLDSSELESLVANYSDALLRRELIKFVPASGEASRMFRLPQYFYNLYEDIDQETVRAEAERGDADHRAFLSLIENIKKFAFYDDLRSVMTAKGADLEDHISKGRFGEILGHLLTSRGLDYARLPKGLIKFHTYADHSRTPLEEHLVEAAAYARDKSGVARIHFTVSQDHKMRMAQHLENVRGRFEGEGVRFDIGFSVQRPSTDTIAVDLDNRPFRTDDNKLLFRAAGHGALLENLNDIGGDIIFIKNIDNVVPDGLKNEIYFYKKAMAGYLAGLQERIFRYLGDMSCGDCDEKRLDEILRFLGEELSASMPQGVGNLSREELKMFLFSKLNRPIRVCGVVKNHGEPGGGPFWVKNTDGSRSLQIVESSQVDLANPEQRGIWESATHFSPVDIVCGVRDYRGRQFRLRDFQDPTTAFISTKSKNGKHLKALEHPGLWNGSMANWITVFIEVPITTFNPVKTVLDLLRKEHQGF